MHEWAYGEAKRIRAVASRDEHASVNACVICKETCTAGSQHYCSLCFVFSRISGILSRAGTWEACVREKAKTLLEGLMASLLALVGDGEVKGNDEGDEERGHEDSKDRHTSSVGEPGYQVIS